MDVAERAPRRRPSVRGRLAAMLALAVMPAAALSVADGLRTYTSELRAAERSFMNRAIVEAQAERDAFVGVRYTLSALTTNPDLREFDAAACDEALRAFDRRFSDYTLAILIDLEGYVRCASQPEAKGVYLGDVPGFAAYMHDPGFRLSLERRGRITGEKVIAASAPISSDEGAILGRVSLSLPVRLIAFLAADTPRGERRAVVDAGGALLFAHAGDDNGDAGWLPSPEALVDRLSWQPHSFSATARDGEGRVYVAAPVLDQRAWLIAAAEHETVYAGLALRALVPIAAPFVMLAIAVFVAYVALDRLVVRHVVYLARITRAYGRGRLDLRPRATDDAPAEIANLGEDLSAMASRLEARQEELKEIAEANRALLLEVYHRVKNNLQMIASLLSLQVRRARSEAEREALTRIQTRIHSMSTVHELLYGSRRLSRVPLDQLVRDVAANLAEGAGGRAALAFELAPLWDTPERATPLALFVNEAVTNAMKHGPDQAGANVVSVTLSDDGAGGFTLEVANPARPDADPSRSGTLGRRLMEGFARQLGGEMTQGFSGGRFILRLVAPGPAADAASAA